MNGQLKVLVDRVAEAKLVSVAGGGPNFEYLRADPIANQVYELISTTTWTVASFILIGQESYQYKKTKL